MFLRVVQSCTMCTFKDEWVLSTDNDTEREGYESVTELYIRSTLSGVTIPSSVDVTVPVDTVTTLFLPFYRRCRSPLNSPFSFFSRGYGRPSTMTTLILVNLLQSVNEC